MVDLVKLFIKAGDGGDGRISFHRAKYIPKGGPDGGDGGEGGNVLLRGNRNLHSLRDFAGLNELIANNGQGGGRDKSFGHKGDDLVMDIPLGTRVWKVVETFVPIKERRMYWVDKDTGRQERNLSSRRRQSPMKIVQEDGVFELKSDRYKRTHSPDQDSLQTMEMNGNTYTVELVGEVTKEGENLRIVRGGKGGKGNWMFRSSTNTTPIEAETGEGGERGDFIFELQVLADVGLIGYPNAGKSTLLSVLTKASPKIANYPFTTLEPNLGVLEFQSDKIENRHSLLIADIPGIIEGASEGKGLGFEFLRHIHRCRIFLFVLGLEDTFILENVDNPEVLTEELMRQYTALENELQVYASSHGEAYAVEFKNKRRCIVINKTDLMTSDCIEAVKKGVAKKVSPVFTLSAKTRDGIEKLSSFLRELTSSE